MTTTARETQSERILRALNNGGRITPLVALNRYGCMRLASRIHDLKRRGYAIEKEMVTAKNGARVAAYYIERGDQ